MSKVKISSESYTVLKWISKISTLVKAKQYEKFHFLQNVN